MVFSSFSDDGDSDIENNSIANEPALKRSKFSRQNGDFELDSNLNEDPGRPSSY